MPKERELRAGDLIRWTRNDALTTKHGESITLSNGHEATVLAVNQKGQVARQLALLRHIQIGDRALERLGRHRDRLG